MSELLNGETLELFVSALTHIISDTGIVFFINVRACSGGAVLVACSRL